MRDAFELDGDEHEVWLSCAPGGYRLHRGAARHTVGMAPIADAVHRLVVDGRAGEVLVAVRGDEVHVHLDGHAYQLRYRDALQRLAAASHSAADDVVRAPMPGTAIAVHVKPGQHVHTGEPLLVMESMKLETSIAAWRDGTVRALHVAAGGTFERDAVLVELEPADQEEPTA